MDKHLEEQFVEQLETNQNLIHKVCRLYTHDVDAHNDLFRDYYSTMEIVQKTWGDSKFSTWMYRVALNTAIIAGKSKRSIQTQEFDTVQFKIQASEYDDTEEQQLNEMYKAIRALNDIEKALVFVFRG